MIVAVPSAIAVTNPADETVATDEFDVTHVTVGFEITLPPAFLTVARSVAMMTKGGHHAKDVRQGWTGLDLLQPQ